MILQIGFTLIYRIVLETSGAIGRQTVELHWRDFAVFVSLSSRTNTLPEGFALVQIHPACPTWRLAYCSEQDPDPRFANQH